MDDIADIQSVDDVCRLCLSPEEPKSSIFADRASSISLATKIQVSLSIEILYNDRLSTLICSNCLRRVNQWYAYKESCLRSQEKLEKWLGEQLENVTNIKTEPMDFEEPSGIMEMVPLTSDEEWESLYDGNDESTGMTISTNVDEIRERVAECATIKNEPFIDEEYRGNAETESIGRTELLLNPMAMSGNEEDGITETDPTEKLFESKILKGMKRKKGRRGPRTHYRGLRQFKQKCTFCQIFLHSKFSYSKHMERFHSGKVYERKKNGGKMDEEVENGWESMVNENGEDDIEEEEEMIEDVEEELISLEKDAPLTPVQQNIISQLKTFSCYSCRQCFHDRRATLNHIRQHMPDLRPYTCIACLTEFADRSIYKLHCGASFQCAMKIALVVPEHGTEKYFTCNMCLRPLNDRKELLSHLSKHSDKQYEQLVASPLRSPPKLKPMMHYSSPKKMRGTGIVDSKLVESFAAGRERKAAKAPYKNGDPSHNHTCDHCGMIYRYKQNLVKHREMCSKLPPSGRISYRCVHCGMTFLVFNKFHAHLNVQHKRRDITCYHCNSKFHQPSDFLVHYQEHRVKISKNTNRDDARSRKVKTWDQSLQAYNRQDFDDKIDRANAFAKISGCDNKYSCALCPNSFPTRSELAEHRKFHLKLKIYSCSVCRRMFGRAAALETHMADHDVDMPNTALDADRSIPVIDYGRKKFKFDEDPNTSKCSINTDPGANNTECHTCGKVFANYPNLRRHVRNAHDAIGRFSCFTCAKTFKTEDQWADHVENVHQQIDPTLNCPQCPEAFDTQEALNIHRQDVHGSDGDNHLACYICGKTFVNETSLKIHRGHHFRVNSRLSISNLQKHDNNHQRPQEKHRIDVTSSPGRSSMDSQIEDDDEPIVSPPSVKSPRARKSFPNSPAPLRQLQSLMLQCQVCDDRFADVSNLRKHLWDVHCARNKPEKTFETKALQCNLCTNILPDEGSLKSHMKWHDDNPILVNKPNKSKMGNPAKCDVCGKFYSSIGNLRQHQKLHKAASAVTDVESRAKSRLDNNLGVDCDICRQTFATKLTLVRHKMLVHPNSVINQNEANRKSVDVKPSRASLEIDKSANYDDSSSESSVVAPGRKPLTCTLCRKIVPTMRSLFRHRKRAHNLNRGHAIKTEFIPDNSSTGQIVKPDPDAVTCPTCPKRFSNMPNLKQHFTKVHGTGTPQRCNVCFKLFPSLGTLRQHYTRVHGRSKNQKCTIEGCRLFFDSLIARQNHEKTHMTMIYTCVLCPYHMYNKPGIIKHISTSHKIDNQSGSSKIPLYKKTNLETYVVLGAKGRQCPVCKIHYPNIKALKIHYLKNHESLMH